MHITVNKVQDGNTFITKDSFGELFAGEVEVDDPAAEVSDDASVSLVTRYRYDEPYVVGLFSWVDYKDTSTASPHPVGVRHTSEWAVPGGTVLGPYIVLAED